jgi:NAD(P)-dependent dehydrogenase (short-subunit alcohol dehydrogenase family)
MPLALVTGGSRGIGRAIVERLARDGADIAFVYRRDEAAAADVVRRVEALGRRCIALRADLGDPGAVAAALARLDAETVDVFVANAAAAAFKPLLEVKPHHVEKTFAITIGAFLQIVQSIAPRAHHRRLRGDRGRDAAARARHARRGRVARRVPLLAGRGVGAGPGHLPRRWHLPARPRPQRAMVATDGTDVARLHPPAPRG